MGNCNSKKSCFTSKYLQSYDHKTPLFSLKGFKTYAKIVKVYDGDTVHVVFYYMNNYYRWVCRIQHIDTCELTSKEREIKKKAYDTKDIVSKLLLNNIFIIICDNFDKYGRLLIDIKLNNNIMFSNWMIHKNLAKSYEGGTKN